MSLVHAEYIKLSRRRLYPVMIAILAVLVGMLAFLFLVLGQWIPELADQIPVLEKPGAYDFGAQQVAGQTWFPLILAVVMLGSEFGSTVWATALSRDSRKMNQISARFLILVIASWLAITLATAGWAVVVAIASPGTGGPDLSEWLDIVWKLGLVQLTWVAIGLAAVALFRSVGPAIGAALALYFVDPILGLIDAYENISISAATTALFPSVTLGGDLFESLIPGAGLSTTHALGIMVGWAALGFVLTWWGLQRRDA